LDLGDVVSDLFDVVDSCAPGEAQLSKRFYYLPNTSVVNDGRVTTDDPARFQAVDAPLNGGRREPDLAPDVPEGTAGVLLEQLQDAFIRVVQVANRG
jgi:hypothetical protein